MTRLETNIEAFQANSKEARTVTSDYGIELEQHVTDLEQLEKTGRIVSSLADIAKVMLDRTRKAEDDMRKSEDERSDENTSELQTLMRISYAAIWWKKKTNKPQKEKTD